MRSTVISKIVCPQSLEYDSSPRPRRWWPLWVSIIVLLVAGFFVPDFSIRQELGRIDAISGSRKGQTVWRFGFSTTPVVSVSPLESRFRKLGLQWQPDWRNIKGTYVDVFGRSVGHGHGLAPEIYSLNFDLQQAFVAASSDDEIREFFGVMSSGTEAGRKDAIEAAEDKALDHLRTSPVHTSRVSNVSNP